MGTPVCLERLEAALERAWVPHEWKRALTALVAEVRWLRRLGERALLELQFPVEDGRERAELLCQLREITRQEG